MSFIGRFLRWVFQETESYSSPGRGSSWEGALFGDVGLSHGCLLYTSDAADE